MLKYPAVNVQLCVMVRGGEKDDGAEGSDEDDEDEDEAVDDAGIVAR